MTDWIEHTGDTCPVDPETVVEVCLRGGRLGLNWTRKAGEWYWGGNGGSSITKYRIVTPAKPPEPQMPKTHEDYTGPTFGVPTKPEPDFVALRLECLKLALQESSGTDHELVADRFLHYVLNGSVGKA